MRKFKYKLNHIQVTALQSLISQHTDELIKAIYDDTLDAVMIYGLMYEIMVKIDNMLSDRLKSKFTLNLRVTEAAALLIITAQLTNRVDPHSYECALIHKMNNTLHQFFSNHKFKM